MYERHPYTCDVHCHLCFCEPIQMHLKRATIHTSQSSSGFQMVDQLSMFLIQPIQHIKSIYLITKVGVDESTPKSSRMSGNRKIILRTFNYGTCMITLCSLVYTDQAKQAKLKQAKTNKCTPSNDPNGRYVVTLNSKLKCLSANSMTPSADDLAGTITILFKGQPGEMIS